MQDLQEVTQEVHYENYRSDRLAKGITKGKENGIKPERESIVVSNQIVLGEKDRILQEKDAELRRMQEMLAQMQAKMQAQQWATAAAEQLLLWWHKACTKTA